MRREKKLGDGKRMTEGREQKAEGGGQRPAESGPKTEDGQQASATDNQSSVLEKVSPDKRTCFFCAYACLMPRGRSFLMGMNLRRPLVCLNHPAAPGEFREVLGNSTCPNFRARREPPLRVPPPEPPNDKVKFIALTRGQHVMVDAADFKRLNKHKWCAVPNTNGSGYYATRGAGGRTIFMHREIVNAPDAEAVDHANRNPSDNRQCNLRPCTQQQNVCNRRSPAHSSQYQGVWYAKTWGKWVANIRLNGRSEHLGAFDDEVEAAKVRDRWAFAFRGRFAYLNFPADFVGKDPADPEFQALRDQLAEKRRRREERRRARSRKGKGESKKATGTGKGAKGKEKKAKPKRRSDKRRKPEATEEG